MCRVTERGHPTSEWMTTKLYVDAMWYCVCGGTVPSFLVRVALRPLRSGCQQGGVIVIGCQNAWWRCDYFAAASRMAAERLRASARRPSWAWARVASAASMAFVDAGNDDGGVAGELAGGVDGVLVPGASGQAGGVEQGLFGGAQGVVERGRVGGRGRPGWRGWLCRRRRSVGRRRGRR